MKKMFAAFLPFLLLLIVASACTLPSGGDSAGEVGSGLDLPITETPPPGAISEGMFQVGTEFPAGTYRTAGARNSAVPNCYWERLSNASGEFEAIITNGNTTGPVTVTLKEGEYFSSMGCAYWMPV